ncbi:hypothetical protein QR685DRAFT_575636 [Neurospora intermedia]|uniref:Uncharacterized protein n=1 Tax=Neurospora intermedia TaxID=5142 RepID=A0ABR3D018_NEUIN
MSIIPPKKTRPKQQAPHSQNNKMCTKKQYHFVVCGHTEWCESQCQTKMKRTLMNPKDEEYPPPCIPVTEVTDPIRLAGKCSTCRPRTRSARSAFGTTSATSASGA